MELILPKVSKILMEQFPLYDQVPRLKIFNPNGCHTWLICGRDPVAPDQLFGLCDLGQGFPELGYVSLSELVKLRSGYGLPMERDMHFEGQYRISVYAEAARHHEYITEDASNLAAALFRVLDRKENEKADLAFERAQDEEAKAYLGTEE